MAKPELKEEWIREALGVADLLDLAGRQGKTRYTGIACSCGGQLNRLFFEAQRKQLGAECMRCGRVKRFLVGERPEVS